MGISPADYDVAVEQVVHDGSAARVGQHFAAAPIKPRDGMWNSRAHAPDPWFTILIQSSPCAPPASQSPREKRFGAVNDQQLDRLLHFAIDRAASGSRLPTSARSPRAHHLDQNSELQFAAALTLKVSCPSSRREWTVGEQFFVEPLAQVARRHPLALAPGEGRGVDVKAMAMVGSSIWICGSGVRCFGAGTSADGDALHAGDGERFRELPRFRPRASALRRSRAW